MPNRNDHSVHFNTLILAGGFSSRMNYPKAWLPFNDHHTFLENIVMRYALMGSERVVVVLNREFYSESRKFVNGFPLNVRFVVNEAPELGRMHSLQLGIPHLTNSNRTVIHNVDNPYVNKAVIDLLLRSENMGYVKPSFHEKNGHPIVVTEKVLESIRQSTIGTNLRDLLHQHICTRVPVHDPLILCNINTQEEYETLFNRKVPETV